MESAPCRLKQRAQRGAVAQIQHFWAFEATLEALKRQYSKFRGQQ